MSDQSSKQTQQPEPITPEEFARRKKLQRSRSIAIGLACAAFAIAFYFLTIVRMGPDIFNRTL